MTEFWKAVDNIGWGTRRAPKIPLGQFAGRMNILAIQRLLHAQYTKSDLEAFALFARALVEALKSSFNTWAQSTNLRLEIGDDAFDDLLSHIVGLGKVEYDACTADPQRIVDRAVSGKYEENFRYCLQPPV